MFSHIAEARASRKVFRYCGLFSLQHPPPPWLHLVENYRNRLASVQEKNLKKILKQISLIFKAFFVSKTTRYGRVARLKFPSNGFELYVWAVAETHELKWASETLQKFMTDTKFVPTPPQRLVAWTSALDTWLPNLL